MAQADSVASLQGLLGSCPFAVARLDHDGRYLYANPAMATLLARPLGDIVGKTFHDVGLAEAKSQLWLDRLRRVFETGEAARFDAAHHTDGAVRELVVHYVPEKGDDGKVTAVLAYLYVEATSWPAAPGRDESRLALATKLAHVGIWDWDIASDRTVWNDEMFRIFGVRPEDFTGKGTDYLAFTRADYREAQRANIERAYRRGFTEAEALAKDITFASSEICIVRPDGEERFVLGDAIAIVDEQRRPVRILGVTMDITERKKAEERFTKAFRLNPAPMAITSMDGRVIDANDAYTVLLGFSAEESRGVHTSTLGMWHDPALREALVAKLLAEGGFREVPVQLRTSTGERREVVMSSTLITLGGERCVLSFATDHTEQNRLQAQLLQAQKLEAIGRLAGGVAHDFNNLLAIVNGCVLVCLKKTGSDDPLRSELEAIKAAGQRGAELTRQLLAFGRRQVLRPTILDLSAVVRGFEPLVPPILGDRVKLVTRLSDTSARIEADRVQTEQVLMNLVVNARDAMPDGGTVTIEVAQTDCDVTLTVSDTGEGMDEELQRRVFEPFFTTKESGKGTGLGLATVHAIVEQSGGTIAVRSAPGRGTTFVVRFPRVP